ncbi:MAG TPA: asparagine synthase (glutamine-hydrolyzing) [Solirubrobacteraceae bacterium]|nr:asparagine synthase (glutamine-hydrolyzing) [Solirubrobacteraceae bacterium]
MSASAANANAPPSVAIVTSRGRPRWRACFHCRTLCGICGSTADLRGTTVAAMNAMMSHRGPDDEGSYLDPGGVALGARRLSIIDIEGGHQPVANERRTVWAVLNGEIYNHPALRRQLLAGGHELRSRTDTEVLVHLYEEYGEALVHALEGMYCFAIWDAERGRLVLGRDRFGEKPLFYWAANGGLTFASELTALQRGLDLGAAAVDADALAAFLALGYVPGPRSMVRDISQLPPASVLTWSVEDPVARVSRYWRLPDVRPAATASLEVLTAELDVAFSDAVRSRLVADVPVGVLLSGGVDSALVAAYATRIADEQVKTFTVGYDCGQVDETGGARRVAGLLGTDHREMVLTSAAVADLVPALLGRLDQPIADPALVALHAVCGFAREHVTVALGGEGADELFAGYPRYRWLAVSDRLARAAPAPLLAVGAGALNAAGAGRRLGRMADVLAPRPLVDRHLDWVTDGLATSSSDIWGAALRGRPAPFQPGADASELIARSGVEGTVRAFMTLDQERWLPDDVLTKADRSSMLVSLEMRTPFLDRSLAEFAASVPVAMHAGPRGKRLLRSLLDQVLPELRDAPRKTAFRVPLAQWLRGPLRPTLEAQIADGSAFAEQWLDRAAVSRVVDEHMAGGADHSRLLWSVLALGCWLDAQRGASVP